MSEGGASPATGRSIVIGREDTARSAIKRVLLRIGVETALEASSPAEAAERAHGMDASLIVVGQRLVDPSDVLACRAIRDTIAGSRLVALTWYASGRDWLLSLLAGASACIVWHVRSLGPTTEIARRVLNGENLIAVEHPNVLQELLNPRGKLLSDFESRVALSIANLERDSEIAERLGVPLETVRASVASILERIPPTDRF
jgi:DNA-binding NarL/FixJ family response regulator